MKNIVIVGGGFAGLNCARELASTPDVHITLIDKNNYQQFQPLLYQVATGILAPGNAAFSLRSIFREHSNVDIKMAAVVSGDLSTKTIATEDGKTYRGDFLVLATGAKVNFFNTPGAEKNAYPLYSLRDAELLRSRILMLLESADREPARLDSGALNFVVVGAGPTGTETAGALADLFGRVLKGSYRDLDLSRARVILVDLVPKTLNAFSEGSQVYASQTLKERGVELILGVAVKEVHADFVLLSDGRKIPSFTTIWAGGLQASPLSSALGVKTGRGGRIDVEADLSIRGFPGIYALGDFANAQGEDGKPLPQLASVAQQAGRYCAKAITSEIAGIKPEPFSYFDKGIMAMVGRNAAVAEVGEARHELTGPVAFAAWLGVHALLLVTLRAKIEAFFEWAWDYFNGAYVHPILDRPEQVGINWHPEEK
jgi:NADH dehydrogenase